MMKAEFRSRRRVFVLLGAAAAAVVLYAGCSVSDVTLVPPPGSVKSASLKLDNRYLESGTIILSHVIPEKQSSPVRELASGGDADPKLMAPLIGYFPPSLGYLPADNETWLEIVRESKKLVLHRGNSVVKELQAEGAIDLSPGEYYLQNPLKDPLWYAPDEYFKKRKLRVPPDGDRMRYRRGALGKYALYITTTFPIHCGSVWTEDVGGLRVSTADMSAIYYMLPMGTPVIIR
ncbi:MAG TPA: L,D-transpeptidase [Oligoflexia bacterium]|nr:L,D-transpeptidase [Oligoflexia bacterium]